MRRALALMTPATRAAVLDLARLPQAIRGFGPVKAAAAARAEQDRAAIWARILHAPVASAAE
jgi:indolepyruvate ferredoxin oxidoreductase